MPQPKKLQNLIDSLNCLNAGDTIKLDYDSLKNILSLTDELVFRMPSAVTQQIVYPKAQNIFETFQLCPRCNAVLGYIYQGYCDTCGQKLKWN